MAARGMWNDEVSAWEEQNPHYWDRNQGAYIGKLSQMGRVYKGVGNSYFEGNFKDGFGHDIPWVSLYRNRAERGEYNPYANLHSHFNFRKIYGDDAVADYIRNARKGNFEDYIYNLDHAANASHEERRSLRNAINNLWRSAEGEELEALKADWYANKMDEERFNRMGLGDLGFKWDPEWETRSRLGARVYHSGLSDFAPAASSGGFLKAYNDRRTELSKNKPTVASLFKDMNYDG